MNKSDEVYSNKANSTDITGLKILDIQETERQRIARELHDTTVQNLTSLIHRIELCSKYYEKDAIQGRLELEIINKILRETINDLRETIYNLRPMAFDDLGLNTTLERSIHQIEKLSDTKIRLETEGEESVNVNQVVEITILRIIQEICNNCIKHAKADKLLIKIKYTEEKICIICEDDGIGFEPDKKKSNNKNNLGLKMMKERVKLLDGKININTSIGNGTKIEIVVPVV